MPMRESCLTATQIVEILERGDGSVPIVKSPRRDNISKATDFQWDVPDAGVLWRRAEGCWDSGPEDAKLKRMYALEDAAVKDISNRKVDRDGGSRGCCTRDRSSFCKCFRPELLTEVMPVAANRDGLDPTPRIRSLSGSTARFVWRCSILRASTRSSRCGRSPRGRLSPTILSGRTRVLAGA